MLDKKTTELEAITIPTDTAMAVFSAIDTGLIDPILSQVRQHIDDFLPSRDVKTPSGRKTIASMAFKIAKAKTAMEAAGRECAAVAKEIPKRIDANRRHIKDTLDMWRDEVREPLDKWEAAEDARVKAHTGKIESIIDAGKLPLGITSSEISERISQVCNIVVGAECEEYLSEYKRAKFEALELLNSALVQTKQQEQQAAELDRLRKEAEERARKDRDEELQRAAADKARIEAEQKARDEIEARERAAMAEKQAIEAKAAAERDAILKSEREAIEAKELAERRANEAEAAARDKLAREKEAARIEEEKRAANVKHKAGIHRAAMAALIAEGLTEECAKAAVTAIARGSVPHIAISY